MPQSITTTTVTVNRGDYVVGLQPDDRMPNDWLRMVARVFTAYRLTPLERSIVAYIDGYHLSKLSQFDDKVIVSITDGTAFVDDQFIGFEETSTMEIDTDIMVPNQVYAIVLCYTWINIMPPQQPTFDIIVRSQIDHEHMLELGTAVKDDDGNVTITDNKLPWIWQLIMMFVGDAEVDGIDPDSVMLPYLIMLKESGQLDVGCALDFHRRPGNHVDYDVRLSCNPHDQMDENLYINGQAILVSPDESSIYDDIQDRNRADKFLPLHANFRLVDSSRDRDGLYSSVSDSLYVNYELVTYHPGTGDPSGPHSIYNDAAHGAKMSQYHLEHEFHIINYYDFDDPSTVINDFMLSDVPGDIYINNSRILVENNFNEIPPALIFFLGKFGTAPMQRPPLHDGSPGGALQDGDMYYDLTEHSYYFWEVDHWTMVGANASVYGGMNEFVASANQTHFPPAPGSNNFLIDPDFIIISRAGLVLSKGEDYSVHLNSEDLVDQVILTNPAEAGERINIYTINVGEGRYTPVSSGGAEYMDDLLDADTVAHPPIIGQVLKWDGTNWSPADDFTGDLLEPKTYEWYATQNQTVFNCEYNPAFVQVSVSGVLLAKEEFTATDGQTITLDHPLNARELVSVYTIVPGVGGSGGGGATYMNDLLDVDTATHNPVSGQILSWNGTHWVPVDNLGGGGGSAGDPKQYEFIALDGQTVFNCEYNVDFVVVFANGIQLSSDKFTATNGTSITFDDPRTVNDIIQIQTLLDTNSNPNPNPPPANSTEEFNFTATGGQTTFEINGVYNNSEEVDVYIDGVRISSTDYQAALSGNSGTTNIVLNQGVDENTWVVIVAPSTKNKYNYVSTSGQLIFDVPEIFSNNISVYTDGIRNRNTEYSVAITGSTTRVTFNIGRSEDAWILIEE
jgi:hypothetical protein